jgi:hypothetical protein
MRWSAERSRQGEQYGFSICQRTGHRHSILARGYDCLRLGLLTYKHHSSHSIYAVQTVSENRGGRLPSSTLIWDSSSANSVALSNPATNDKFVTLRCRCGLPVAALFL